VLENFLLKRREMRVGGQIFDQQEFPLHHRPSVE
jgi:hypothetical protein